MSTVLARLQRGLEALYRVQTHLAVEQFLVDEKARGAAHPARSPREQLLLHQADDDELAMGLFVDGHAIDNLERNDPGLRLDDGNFDDFCLAVEGVSHFVYLALCAADDRRVSALELELQAEVDKFACCALLANAGALSGHGLRRRLYDDVTFAGDLDRDEHDRYRAANAEARRYAVALDERYVAADRVGDMVNELRWFYRQGLDGKLGHIARRAA
ncbi:MAG TPA: hypothetical protein VHU40_00990 [Polyangia bacterium]|nr:hypothetical protein [Polyangia bacterium]